MAKMIPTPVFWKGKGKRAVLLIHGFTGSTLEVMPLASHFQRLDYHVAAPLLAGHGTSPEELHKTSREDWFHSVVTAYQKLMAWDPTEVYVIGHSMGGLLAIQLASLYSIKALATLSTPIFVRDQRIKYVGFLKYILSYSKRSKEKPAHIEEHIFPYQRTPLASVHQLSLLIKEVKALLSSIQSPIFIAQSGQDETVDPSSADYIFREIGSNYKEKILYPKSTHIITFDIEREKLCKDLTNFIQNISDAKEGR
ncbi:alpha/beta hydrolase [Ammoniphilus resinae]|uniref:Carboxylesterase n=1 Tax=Ammoniphilus resinae TaxID=861532 RepID=A0ABS4GR69_9BACL|nr:alpha/beta fold hydrolase [Ammoniphilus resinae]MBP1932622.1 carboxylesterase [Ammoniphilus resinae]